ncbi:MAG: hydantoinase/oxoprolinase family protein, partial [Schwartzia sp.]|nr:hydantoinase/oxoprolinase family protein [Schwartzia sp. (in: firmicutes)]
TNILRATATGATELKKDSIGVGKASAEELKETAARSMRLPAEEVTEAAAVGKWDVFEGMVKSKFWGIFPSKKRMVRVIDRNGVMTLQREGLGAVITNKHKLKEDIDTLFEETAAYGTIGEELPPLYAYYGEKQLDLSGLTAREQIISVLEAEFDILPADEKIILLAVR